MGNHNKTVFVDTNILLNPKFDFNKYKKIYMSIVTVQELDNLKRNERLGYQARTAIKNIEKANNVEIRLHSSFSGVSYLENNNDNIILSSAYDVHAFDKDCVFLTDDYALKVKADALELPCKMFEYGSSEVEVYKGIRELTLTEEEYVNLLENPKNNLYNLCPNEYIIVNNTTKLDQYLLVWNGNYFEEVKVKPISNKYLNKISPLDIYQKAFIHMLQSDNIKIKITDSIYGAGKSYLMIHWTLQMIEKEKFDKIYFIKSDSPPKGRKEFPAIPGGIEEKCEPLMGVLCDTTNEDSLVEILLRNNKLKILPIQFVKGRSIRNSIIYVNECQDFTPSEIERILSRLGEGSVALLDGSTKQTDNKYCLHRSGLTVASNNYKNSKNAAQVNMIEDYRSDISKEVGEMDWSD